MIRDLAPYFAGQTRPAILHRVIEEFERHESDGPLCVVSHSTGTIVAFDAALHWQGKIDTFVTLGSSLGWEYAKQALGRPVTRKNVRLWFNMYDKFDNVSLPDRGVTDDYPTAEGARRAIDVRVRDNYAPNGDRDPHHWFGYLTSPQFIDIPFWMGTQQQAGPVPVSPRESRDHASGLAGRTF